MVECPFCGSEVTEDLVMYGGTCPKCFAEIPGDEAPTDPGAEVRAAQEAKDRRGRTLKIAALLSVLVGLVFCTGGGAVVAALWPEPEVAELLNFDELDIPLPDLVGAPPEGVATAAQPKPSAPKPKPSAGLGSDPAVISPGQEVRPRSTPAPTGPVTSVGSGASAPKPPSIDLGISSPKAVRGGNEVLSDPETIRTMIGQNLRDGIPQLKTCYDRYLKVDESLKGRWLIKFTVQPSGKPSSVSADGIDRSHAELEQCMVRHIEQNWKFSRITVAQPVQRTVTLAP